MMKAKRVVSALLGLMMSLASAVLMLSLLLNGCGTSAPLMCQMMQTHAPSAVTQLPDEDYAPMAAMITGYLAGDVETFQYALETPEGMAELFHDYEQQHMADCKALFALCRAVLLCSAMVVAISAVALGVLRCARQGALGCMVGTLAVMVCVAGAAVWAAIDFDGLFILFHKLSFSNGLWMLNPATDMLIRLMPLDFFVHYVAMIGVTWGAGLVIMLAVSAMVVKRSKR